MAISGHDFAVFRELGRRNRSAEHHEPPPTDALDRVAWAAGWNDDAALQEAVAASRAAGASWAEIAEAIGSGAEDVVRAEYEHLDRQDQRTEP